MNSQKAEMNNGHHIFSIVNDILIQSLKTNQPEVLWREVHTTNIKTDEFVSTAMKPHQSEIN